MNDKDRRIHDGKPNIAVIADPDGLAVNLVEILLSEICRVNIVSEKTASWNYLVRHLRSNKSLSVSQEKKKYSYDYVIYFTSYFSNLKIKEIESFKALETVRLKKTLDEVGSAVKKIIFVFPFIQLDFFQKVHTLSINKINNISGQTIKTIFVGQPVGPRIVLSKKDVISGIQRSLVTKDPIVIPKSDGYVYPVDVRELARGIIKETFSFTTRNSSIALLGSQYSYNNFINKFIGNSSEVNPIEWEQVEFDCDERLIIGTDINRSLEQCIAWFREGIPPYLLENISYEYTKTISSKKPVYIATPVIKPTITRVEKKESPPSKKVKFDKNKRRKVVKSNYFKYVKWPAIVLVCLLVIPYVFKLAGISSFALGARYLQRSNNTGAQKALKISENMSGASQNIFIYYSGIPLIGSMFDQQITSTGVLKNSSDLFLDINDIAIDLSKLTKNVFSDDPYDIENISRDIVLKLDSIYKKSAFIESEVGDYKGFESDYISRLTGEINTQKVRNEILAGKEIAGNLPALLGAQEDKTYLVLFQNNLELRPTGGFIGAFALVTFSKGRLTDINMMDIYLADEQMKGNVEPPEPIKKHLNEANWYFRDSNWDPDFPTSAERAEWFLDKEVLVDVDGVIVVDLELIKDIIEIEESLYLTDFNKEITANNLYEVAQEESEKDLFPGSKKKAFFLTSLSQGIIDLISSGDLNDFKLAQTIYTNLEEKHAQVFLHDENSQNAISKAQWGGEVKLPSCDIDNCYADFFGIAEANFGKNKANYFIKRSMEIGVFLDEDIVERKVEITLKNNANPALGDRAKYTSYLRVMVPRDSFFDEVEISGSENTTTQPEIKYYDDRVEAGILTTVIPEGETKLTYRWTGRTNLDFEDRGEYRLHVRKQAGTFEDPLTMLFRFPDNVNVYGNPVFGLTEEGYSGYNTTLINDKYMLIYW